MTEAPPPTPAGAVSANAAKPAIPHAQAPVSASPVEPVRTTLRHDLALRRVNKLVLLAICAGAMAWLGLRDAGRLHIGEKLPVYPARIAQGAEKIDPNTASAASLDRLPELGPTLVRRIVEYRQAAGGQAFRQADDLKYVKGIGPATLEKIRPYLRFPSDSMPSEPG